MNIARTDAGVPSATRQGDGALGLAIHQAFELARDSLTETECFGPMPGHAMWEY
jgi:hypothetical protein